MATVDISDEEVFNAFINETEYRLECADFLTRLSQEPKLIAALKSRVSTFDKMILQDALTWVTEYKQALDRGGHKSVIHEIVYQASELRSVRKIITGVSCMEAYWPTANWNEPKTVNDELLEILRRLSQRD